jgi:ABC-type multidrug transport system ATPase subunit
MQPPMHISAENIARMYGRKVIFKNVDFAVDGGEILAITGRNGSGKTTLLKIAAGLIKPTAGQIIYRTIAGNTSPKPGQMGFCGPYLNLYDQFTLYENLTLFNRLRKRKTHPGWLEKSGLGADADRPLGVFSSGMLQRARLLFAVAHEPEFLLLDEPGSNLDDEGQRFVAEILTHFKNKKAVIVLASNEQREIARATKEYHIDASDDRHLN